MEKKSSTWKKAVAVKVILIVLGVCLAGVSGALQGPSTISAILTMDGEVRQNDEAGQDGGKKERREDGMSGNRDKSYSMDVSDVSFANSTKTPDIGLDGLSGTLASKELFKAYIMRMNPKVFDTLATVITRAIFKASGEYDIHPVYLLALMKIESTFSYNAHSGEAIGLTQINPRIWVYSEDNHHNLIEAGVIESDRDLYHPVKNTMAGAYILREYIDQGKAKGEGNPLMYALTRYLGGSKNKHYDRFIAAIGQYVVFSRNLQASRQAQDGKDTPEQDNGSKTGETVKG